MDAARPALEPLPDLPVEAPADAAACGAKPAPAVTAVPAASAPAEAAGAAKTAPGVESTQTLEFLAPQLLVAPNEAAAAPTPPPPEPPPQVLEVDPDAPLELEKPADVEKFLTTGQASSSTAAIPLPEPPTLSAAPASPSSPAPVAARTEPAATVPPAAAEASTPSLVPLARRASLSAAAVKLAAASAANQQTRSSPRPAKAATAAPATSPAPTPAAKSAPASKAQSTAPAPSNGTSPPSAPSLAAWANARAAATPPPAKSAAAAPTPRGGGSSPKATPPAVAAAPTAKSNAGALAAGTTTIPASPPMDRDFIARNQVVERYLSGRLPIKAATDFERFCRAHPQLLDEMGLPERVNAGLRLLEASGKPEPWQESARPFWQRSEVTLGAIAAAVILGIGVALLAAANSSKTHRIADLRNQVHDRALDPATSTRTVRLMPSRSGASNTPAITIGGGTDAQLVDFRIDESRSPYRDFRVTIDRIDQGRVMVLDNLTKDSNGHLRIALNSSALGPGNYSLTIEGLTLRLDPEPDSWVTIGVAARQTAQ